MSIDWAALVTAEDRDKLATEQARAMARTEARLYLTETDWYVIRALDTGAPVPDAIRAGRSAARALLSSDIMPMSQADNSRR